MALKIYFLRHGQTELSRDNRFCGSGSEPGLTAEGVKMAEAFASSYAERKISTIYASPQIRAQQTASAISLQIKVPIISVPALREIGYGDWEGKTVTEIQSNYHDDHIRWMADPAWNPPTHGESGIEIERRVIGFIDEIRQKTPDGNVLCVSHKATIRIAICALMGIDIGRFRSRISCPVASISIVEFTPTGPILKSLANTDHLGNELSELPGT